MPDENTIIINNYAGGPPQYPLEEIPLGHEVMRYEADANHEDWYLSFPGLGENITIKAGKTYIVYEQDGEG